MSLLTSPEQIIIQQFPDSYFLKLVLLYRKLPFSLSFPIFLYLSLSFSLSQSFSRCGLLLSCFLISPSLSLYLSHISLSIYLSISLPLYLSISLSLYLSLSLSLLFIFLLNFSFSLLLCLSRSFSLLLYLASICQPQTLISTPPLK